jgi:hypothetical protein
MTNNKTWTNISAIITEAISESLEESDVKQLMNAISAKKNDIIKAVEGKATKKKKDPSAPKKPKSAYILYCMEQREKIMKQNPDIKANEIMVKLGEAWKKASEKDKKKFTRQAEEDKARYTAEMENYTPPDDVDVPTRKAKKERTGPKRGMSSYMFFCQDMRPVLKKDKPELKGKEIALELGKRWKALSDKQKAPYIAKAGEDKARYEAEKATLSDSDTKPEAKTVKKGKPETKNDKPAPKKGKQAEESKPETKNDKPAPKKGKQADKPAPKNQKGKKVATNTPGYKTFCEEVRDEIQAEHPDFNSKKVNAELVTRWSALSDNDRESYELEAQADDASEVALDE